jgi:hypothetical protein
MKLKLSRSLTLALLAGLGVTSRAHAQAYAPMPAPIATGILNVNVPSQSLDERASPHTSIEYRVARPQASILYEVDSSDSVDTTGKRSNPAIRGAVIGGAVVGLAAAVYAYHGPYEDEQCIGCAVGGFVMGAVVGAVIGGFIGSALGN